MKPSYARAVPVAAVDDVERALAFYRDRLGLELVHVNRDAHGEDPPNYAVLSGGDASIHLVAAGEVGRAPGTSEVVLQLRAGIDDLCRELRDHGVPLLEELTDQWWGERTFRVADPSGNQITVSQPGGKRTRELIRE